MRITKYHHACVVLEEKGKKLIIDPGNYASSFGDIADVAAVVVTHIHSDHFYLDNLVRIIGQNPAVRIFTTSEVSDQLKRPHVTVVNDGDEHSTGPFKLHFTGDKHAAVHRDWPAAQNTGVRVNQAFYYAGDSLTPPDTPVQILAVPVSNAWMKLGEAMDYLAAVHPELCFPTHDMPLSGEGIATANKWLGDMCEKENISFRHLQPGDFIDIPG